MLAVIKRRPVTAIVFSNLGTGALLSISDALLAAIRVPDEDAIALSLSVTALITVAGLEACDCRPMVVFGRSRAERLLGLIAGALMLLVVGVCVTGLTTSDLSAKLLLGPGAYFEELLFRGIPILILLRGDHSPGAKVGAATTASIIFAIMHPSVDAVMYVDMFVFSLLAFWMAFVSRSLWPSVAFHLLANVAATTVAAPLYWSEARGLFVLIDFGVFLIIWLLALAVAGIVRRKRVRS